jgi:hypothetical protein
VLLGGRLRDIFIGDDFRAAEGVDSRRFHVNSSFDRREVSSARLAAAMAPCRRHIA